MSTRVGPARGEDLTEILALLEGSGLPREGLEGHPALVAREGERVVGSAALELYGSSALLRSVAVADGRRGEGLGGRLTREALALARERGARRAYLLTQTADGFFPRFGFRPVPRPEVPEEVRDSVEFVSACPGSARAMFLNLTEGAR
ncbi:GNAT family N-acetyltransferase [Rubrobacter marinus]|uniref:GNAT family N-acetyltransferase n=1 Tax=Rubrobacter marinus TaxID=2653852 RepID=A0A6G8Q1J3_9ACTN|nr:arsenic resistance N-acetyltransferase ArsN2 [Rubrobacter marinus]QIN80341.1 GNAT family N-acetyltransferase [Rubrobacter marinus]